VTTVPRRRRWIYPVSHTSPACPGKFLNAGRARPQVGAAIQGLLRGKNLLLEGTGGPRGPYRQFLYLASGPEGSSVAPTIVRLQLPARPIPALLFSVMAARFPFGKNLASGPPPLHPSPSPPSPRRSGPARSSRMVTTTTIWQIQSPLCRVFLAGPTSRAAASLTARQCDLVHRADGRQESQVVTTLRTDSNPPSKGGGTAAGIGAIPSSLLKRITLRRGPPPVASRSYVGPP